MKWKIIFFSLLAAGTITMSFSLKKTSFQKAVVYKPLYFSAIDSGDVFVGNRTSDSTATLILTSTDIQESIVSTISYLDGMNLNGASPSLMVTPAAAYIILTGTDESGIPVTVAIQLICDKASMAYRQKSKQTVHICRRSPECSACKFITLGNLILTCQCASQNPADSTAEACHDDSYLIR